MSHQYPRVVQLHLTDEQYAKLKEMSWVNRSDMVALVRQWIDGCPKPELKDFRVVKPGIPASALDDGWKVGGSKKTPPTPVAVPQKPIVEQKVMSAYVSAPVVGGGKVGKDALSEAKEAFKSLVVYPDESVSARHKCAICHLSFPETEMTYHAKTLRWACNDCLEKQA